MMTAAHRSEAALSHPRIEAVLVEPFDVDAVLAALEYVLAPPPGAKKPLAFLRSSPRVADQAAADPFEASADPPERAEGSANPATACAEAE
jgi:hypothetical protein